MESETLALSEDKIILLGTRFAQELTQLRTSGYLTFAALLNQMGDNLNLPGEGLSSELIAIGDSIIVSALVEIIGSEQSETIQDINDVMLKTYKKECEAAGIAIPDLRSYAETLFERANTYIQAVQAVINPDQIGTALVNIFITNLNLSLSAKQASDLEAAFMVNYSTIAKGVIDQIQQVIAMPEEAQ